MVWPAILSLINAVLQGFLFIINDYQQLVIIDSISLFYRNFPNNSTASCFEFTLHFHR